MERRVRRIARAGSILFAVAFVFHFCHFTLGGLNSWFSSDDLMNLYNAWTRSLPELIASNFAIFVPYTRPLGQAFYLALYWLFGFDPMVFNVARLAVAAADVVVMYLLVSRALRSPLAGMCALILVGVHPALFSIYYDTGMIYDALAFLFCCLTLWFYMGIRQRGEIPKWRAMLLLMAFYTCAMNAKEAAVGLPVGVLLYELILTPPQPAWPAIVRWLRREGRFAMAGAAMTFVYLAARLLAPNSLYNSPGFQPDYSLSRYLTTYGTYMAHFLEQRHPAPPGVMAALLAASIGLAALTRRRVLLWASVFNLFSILPVAFIVPRLGFAFYVTLAGWAVLLGGLLVFGCDWLAGKIRFPGRIHPAVQLAVLRATLLAALAALVIPAHARAARIRYPLALRQELQNRTWYREIRYHLPSIPKSSQILIVREPPDAGWNVHFVVPLGYCDRGIMLRSVRQLKEMHSPIQPGEYNLFLDYQEGHFRLMSRQEVYELQRQEVL